MADQQPYEIIVGLEVHAQLLTRSKLFCGDNAEFNADPNTAVSPITLGHPGTLPKMNKEAIVFAIRTGLACNCEIEKENYFARKNYFYPDLPKGYQISQHTTPICTGGFIDIKTAAGKKRIRLNRIHLEEDAGKSLHDADPGNTSVDYNRAGVPLIEIVSEPDIRSGEEAYAFLTELRKLLRYLEVCDGNMEEGSLRCDANISVRKRGNIKLGTKVEVKNLNSIRNVKKAIEFEAGRLIDCLEKGETIIQQTRTFDADSGATFSMREKEDADDYRYFPEPDLSPFHLKDDFIETIKSSIPVLQAERVNRYVSEWKLSEYEAGVLTEDKELSDFFESIVNDCNKPKAVSNWVLGPVKSWMNENDTGISTFPIASQKMSSLIELVESGKLSFSIASARIFPVLINEPQKEPERIAGELNLFQQSDTAFIEPIVEEVLNKFADKVKEYQKGKKGLLALFVGEVIKRSAGKADPVVVNKIIVEKLKS